MMENSIEESQLDIALRHLYNCSHDYKVWTGDYPVWFDATDKAWHDKERDSRYDAMVQAAKMVTQQMLLTHAAHIDPYKKVSWSLDS
jgi:hypothetical protein